MTEFLNLFQRSPAVAGSRQRQRINIVIASEGVKRLSVAISSEPQRKFHFLWSFNFY